MTLHTGNRFTTSGLKNTEKSVRYSILSKSVPKLPQQGFTEIIFFVCFLHFKTQNPDNQYFIYKIKFYRKNKPSELVPWGAD